MTDTRYPASRSAHASFHTRLSTGTGRFSTTMQTAMGVFVCHVLDAASAVAYARALVSACQDICGLALHTCEGLIIVSCRKRSFWRHRRPAYADVVKSVTSHLRRVKHVSAIHDERSLDGRSETIPVHADEIRPIL